MKIKVTCEVPDCSIPAKPNIKVHNHWNSSGLVEIEVDGERYAVDGNCLKRAIDNCMNAGV